jgi:uncharacterized Zn finger protein
MPVALELTEDTVQRLAGDDATMQNARGLVRKNKFRDLAVSPDGSWLLGRCQGSGKDPYEVSCDLADPNNPLGRCTCPSRKFPCKHAVGLMLAYINAPETFGEREPAEDLLAKRVKQAKRAEKQATEATQPRKVNQAAQVKKAAAQREGLDLLEKLLTDLVTGGQWFET